VRLTLVVLNLIAAPLFHCLAIVAVVGNVTHTPTQPLRDSKKYGRRTTKLSS